MMLWGVRWLRCSNMVDSSYKEDTITHYCRYTFVLWLIISYQLLEIDSETFPNYIKIQYK